MPSTVVTAIAAQKGGSGKTALTGSLGPFWAYAGKRTLLVDLDQQANLTFAFAIDPKTQLEGTVVDVLAPRQPMSAEEVILRGVHGVPGLDLLPCDERAGSLDSELRSERFSEFRLRDVLSELFDQYDRVLIDCPPNVGELTVAALLAAHDIICPVRMGDNNALRGIDQLTSAVESLRRQKNGVDVKALVRLDCDDRELSYAINDRKLTEVAKRHKLPIAATQLRARAAWKTAVAEAVPLLLFDRHDRGTHDAQSDLHHLVTELWPDVQFPFPSDILRQRRRATIRVAA